MNSHRWAKLRWHGWRVPREASDSVFCAWSLHALRPLPLPFPERRQRTQCNMDVSAHTIDAKHRCPVPPTATPIEH
eukprot:4730361-Alexandrium_andersonii.AAC.2